MGAMFGGPNAQQTEAWKNLGSIGSFGATTGKADTGKASDFWSSILSGDPSAISKTLAPEISGIQKQTQNRKNTASEFGSRSGGTDATMAMADDNSNSAVNNLVASLTSKAADTLGSLGTNLLSTGTSASSSEGSQATQFQASQAAAQGALGGALGGLAGDIFAPGLSESFSNFIGN